MPAMMAGSERRCSEAGASLPREACTMDMESSTVTDWAPVAWTSLSVRPSTGRMIASRPIIRCDRFSLVFMCTASYSRRMPASHCSVSDKAMARLPPRQISTRV
ncbi:hypothetical protein G6F59_016720 [Rhizopus arrhizus]|nr:hypothetical protein G6F59_016720 [Rhizopus arrhizus]